MRTIGPAALLIFHALLALAIGAGIAASLWTVGLLPLGEYRALSVVAAALVLTFWFAILAYRLFLAASPLHEGDIPEGSRLEFSYHVHLLFDLIVFSPILGSRILPIPLLKLVYLGLGARMGRNSYTAGIICDPIFVDVGDNTILGQDSILVPHALEGDRLGHRRIRIGSNVTVGAKAVVLSGVTIGDGAIVATGAVVKKDTEIAAGEVWGGLPAKRIREPEASPTSPGV